MDCKYCGKPIPIGFGRQRVYCSCECRDKYFYGERKTAKTLTCLICGATLPNKRRAYCSDECFKKSKVKREYLSHKEEYKKPKAEVKEEPKRKRGRPKKKITLAEINERARLENLTYGQYVAKYGM